MRPPAWIGRARRSGTRSTRPNVAPAIDDLMSTAGLDAMIDRHVGWQLAHLGVDDSSLRRFLVEGFVQPVRRASEANARLLAGLRSRDLALGVLSNGCGNVDVLCRDLGYAPYLASIVDSRRVGLSKPDPAIFVHAAATLGVPPHEVLMVGDSFDRDVRPAKAVGMRAAWLEGDAPPPCPDPRCPTCDCAGSPICRRRSIARR